MGEQFVWILTLNKPSTGKCWTRKASQVPYSRTLTFDFTNGFRSRPPEHMRSIRDGTQTCTVCDRWRGEVTVTIQQQSVIALYPMSRKSSCWIPLRDFMTGCAAVFVTTGKHVWLPLPPPPSPPPFPPPLFHHHPPKSVRGLSSVTKNHVNKYEAWKQAPWMCIAYIHWQRIMQRRTNREKRAIYRSTSMAKNHANQQVYTVLPQWSSIV